MQVQVEVGVRLRLGLETQPYTRLMLESMSTNFDFFEEELNAG